MRTALAASVLLSGVAAASPNLPADLNGDGVVGSADMAMYLGAPVDLNGDGVPGTAADLAVILGSWGMTEAASWQPMAPRTCPECNAIELSFVGAGRMTILWSEIAYVGEIPQNPAPNTCMLIFKGGAREFVYINYEVMRNMLLTHGWRLDP